MEIQTYSINDKKWVTRIDIDQIRVITGDGNYYNIAEREDTGLDIRTLHTLAVFPISNNGIFIQEFTSPPAPTL